MEVKHIGRYILGAAAGIIFVASCGSNNTVSVPSSNAAVLTDQMICYAGSLRSVVNGGIFMGQIPLTCKSKGNAAVQTFDDFNAVANAGWTLTSASSAGTEAAYVFQK